MFQSGKVQDFILSIQMRDYRFATVTPDDEFFFNRSHTTNHLTIAETVAAILHS